MEFRQDLKYPKRSGNRPGSISSCFLTEENTLCFTDIMNKFESMAVSILSHHLKQLTKCGLLDLSKDGTYIIYSVNRETAEKYSPFLKRCVIYSVVRGIEEKERYK